MFEGFRVKVAGFRVYGSGFGVQGQGDLVSRLRMGEN